MKPVHPARLALLACLALPAVARAQVPPQDRPDMAWWRESMKTREKRLAWWREARFGMFIHWGIYSQLAGSWEGQPVRGYAEHIQRLRTIPQAVYREQAAARFDPTRFDADQWMRAAKQAGMGYMIITAKHHDGFAMYDSKVSDWDIIDATPFGRDPMRELRDAARRHGVKFGFYYSHAFDWGDPEAPGNDWEWDNPGGDKLLHGGREWWTQSPEYLAKARRYIDRKAIPQIQELIRRYEPDIMWFDTPAKLPNEENLRILKAAREAGPNVVINSRIIQAFPGAPEALFGDYLDTADRPAELRHYAGDTEAIPTTNESYGYHAADSSHKPPEHFVRLLAKAAARGGNLLLNVGPMGDGRMDPRDTVILAGIGRWMAVNRASIRGTERTPLPVQAWGESTRRGSRLYLHVFDWPADGRLHVAGLRSDVRRASLLAAPDEPALAVRRLGPRDVEVRLPAARPDPWDAVVVLDVAGPVRADSALYLPGAAEGGAARLHVFEGRLVGQGVTYSDGKRNNDVAIGWSRPGGGVEWTARVEAPTRFRVSLEYASQAPDSVARARALELALGDARLTGTIAPTGGGSTFAVRELGEVALPAGTHTLAVRAAAAGTPGAGGDLMRLRRLVLEPVSAKATSPAGAAAPLSRAELAALERPRVLAAAAKALGEAPVTVTAVRAARSAGGPHDYFSEGDYWWPDSANPAGPYVQRDGRTNPDNFVAHRDAMRRLSVLVPALAAAYALTGDARYARRAAQHLRAWFVAESTRMTPSLLYAQAIQGRFTGRGIGIIDTIHLVEVARAVEALERAGAVAAGALDAETLAGTRQWFREYLAWMTTHPYGLAERNNGNNHSAAWALQVAAFARLTSDSARLAEMRRFFRETLVPEQMAADGSFPRELARTKPYGYSLFQLDVMAGLAQALSTPDENLWTFATADGRGMRRALAYMAPYIRDKASWPRPPDVMYHEQWPVRHPALLFGGRALGEPSYVALWRTLEPDPAVDEVVRNFPIRQPVLWVE